MAGTLDGKLALVSASRGLWKAIALEFAQAGAHVLRTARSTHGKSTQPELPDTTVEDALADKLRDREVCRSSP